MQGKDFIYFLLDENNNSYYQYGDTVLLSASLKPLEFTPDGWKKIQIQNQRNQTYFAIDRSFTVPLEYVKDGAQILKYIYYNFGVEAKVYMSVCEQRLLFDATNYGFYYTLLYRGEIDLANFKQDSTKVTVNIMEGGMVKLLKAYENTKYEIPVDVPEAVDILMDGVEFKVNAKYVIQEGQSTGIHLPGVLFINSEGTTINTVTNSVFLQGAGSINYETSDQWIMHNVSDSTIQLRIQGFLKVKADISTFYGFGVQIDASTGLAIYTNNSFPSGVETTIPFDVLFDLPPDEKLFFTSTYAGAITTFIRYIDGEVNISYKTKYKASTIKALRPLYIFQQLISKMSDGLYTPSSTYLQSIQDVVVTCGDAVRGITGAKIKTSLRDFFTSYNSDFGIGMGMIGSTLRIEEKGYWVQYADFIDLGEVSKMKVSPATDLLINNIKIGTPNQDYDDVNGKQEFNTTHEYSAPITRIAKDLNLISVYRKDCYGIEFTRLNLDGKATTDNDSDNDVFMIHIEDNPQVDTFYHLDRSLNAGATGLLTPSTVFNLYLTPARGLRRNGSYIRSLFYKLESKYLKFQTTDKNDQVVAGGITERDDMQIVSLDAALFSCNYLEFETKVPFNLLETLNASPLKAFAGTWAGFSFVGIPDKVSIQPGDNGAQTYKLLASPDTNLLTLINIDG